MLEDILIPVAFFSFTFGAIYVFLMTRNRERMAMIERGADPNLFARKPGRLGIKVGLLAIGVAVGILVGNLLFHTTPLGEEPALVSMTFLFAGLGLVIDHYLAKKERGEG